MSLARRWLFPTIMRGHASWCGRFFIISAPPRISQLTGHGTIGLELFRWTEKTGWTLLRLIRWTRTN